MTKKKQDFFLHMSNVGWGSLRPIPRVCEPARAVNVAGSKVLKDPAGNPPGAELLSDGRGGCSGLSPEPAGPTGRSSGPEVSSAAAVAREEDVVVVDLVVVDAVVVEGGGGGPPAAGGGPAGGGETIVELGLLDMVAEEDDEAEVDAVDAAEVVEEELMTGAGGATGRLGARPPVSIGCALLEEGTLLEPEVIVPVEAVTIC